MPVLLEMATRPYYAQVALFDPSFKDSYPTWPDGGAAAAMGERGVAVATRPDHLGDVVITVQAGPATLAEDGRMVASGAILVDGADGVVVGSVIGNDLRPVPLPRGRHPIEVWVKGPVHLVHSVSFIFPNLKPIASGVDEHATSDQP